MQIKKTKRQSLNIIETDTIKYITQDFYHFEMIQYNHPFVFFIRSS